MKVELSTEVRWHFKRVFESIEGAKYLGKFGGDQEFPEKAKLLERKITDREAKVGKEIKNLLAPLVYWKHSYRIHAIGPALASIEERVEFRTPRKGLDLLFYPLIYAWLLRKGRRYKAQFR